MATALKLASKGRFAVGSNPMVGCVIVRDEQIIAKAYHQKFGQNHAEINALESIDFNAKNATIYTTLEPCSHQGKTPSCAAEIIRSKPKKVVIAALDNNPKVSSVALMQAAGIEVVTGILQAQALELNRGFHKRMENNSPFVTCKIASSLDGKIALNSGESKWITNEFSRADVQKLRAQNQAIITGSGTVLADNPSLDVRDKNLPSPIKIVMDRSNKITDKSLNIFKGKQAIITNKTPQQVLSLLAEMQINNVLLEAGSLLSGAFLSENLIDEFIFYQAPILLGKEAISMLNFEVKNMNEKRQLTISDMKIIGDNLRITARIKP
ncbi:MAG: bifunctional diaminohydroxyphosphoribosylaminopyrimidine deaminase/5-amino-6-(5-phosphoribosylamino)uracil reductase RibD [Candidatus Thioglobus sp.]|nr:bifunctional diaminohydroxyphosphoribosylaminopyrimidine deaminase/5-amino-6-(5-phosphoribosylamino)uracil reductase RibD [Candidatus Thioglobus sp.]